MKRNKTKLHVVLLSVIVCVLSSLMITSKAQAAVTVARPTSFKIVKVGYTSVIVKWNKVKDVSGYIVCQYDPSTKKYSKIVAKTTPKESQVQVKGLGKGKFYKFVVRAYKTVNGKHTFSPYSNGIKFVMKQDKLSDLKVTSTGNNYAKLSWTKVSGSKRYRVYRYNTSTKKYTRVADVGTNSAIISNLSPGATYYYVARGYTEAEKCIGYGDLSSKVVAYTAPNNVTKTSQKAFTETSFTIKWDAAKGADGYKIYKYAGDNKWTLKKTVGASTLSYTEDKLTAGKEYKYTVRAYAKFGEKVVPAKKYYPIYAITKPAKVSNLSVSSITPQSVKLSWAKVSGADKYVIYKYNEAKDVYVQYKETTNLSYTISGLESYTSYLYKVNASMKHPQNGKYYLGNGTSKSFRTKLGTPSSLIVTDKTTKSISYKWNLVKNAAGYEVRVYDVAGNLIKKEKLGAGANTYTYETNSDSVINVKVEIVPYVKTLSVSSGATSYKYGSGIALITSNALDAVTGVKGTNYTFDTLEIKWEDVDFAEKYEVYQLKNDDYVKIAETTDTTYKIESLSAGTIYKFKIRAVKYDGTNELKGDYSKVCELVTKHKAPDVKIGEACFKYVKLAWDKMSNVTGYRVYKYDTTSKTYKVIKTIASATTLSYSDSSVSSSKTYKYKVQGYKTIDGINYYGEVSDIVTAKIGVYGVDVSQYQKIIDWNKVKAAGIDYAIIRATRYSSSGVNGTHLTVDSKFHTNMKNAIAAGIKVGVYVYSYASTVTEARKEAEYVVSLVQGYKMTYPIYFDIEEGSRNKSSLRTANTNMAIAFCDTVIEAGYKAGVYSGASFMVNALDLSKLSKYDIWVARYLYNSDTVFNFPSNMTLVNKVIGMGYKYNNKYTSINADMWQYTSSGSISGIPGRVDMNYGYKSY